jgi:2'-5' RNA ligase
MTIFTVGVEADLKLVERLTFLQEDLGKIIAARGGDSRWIRPEYINIPLVYLGIQDDGEIPEMNHILERVVKDISPFRISIAGIQAFPDPTCPRVIQVGVDAGLESLTQLRERIRYAMTEANFGFDPRPFKACMMLGRVLTPNQKVDISDAIDAIKDLNFGGTDVFEIALYNASLSLTGTIHFVVSRHALKGR